MAVQYIGIITGGAQPQSQINVDHAKDIGKALENKYTVSYYDMSVSEDRRRLVSDKKAGKLDIIFNNACGKKGGDGTIEGFLEIVGVPFVGSDTLATAVAFDKKSTKTIVKEAGVRVVDGTILRKSTFENEWEYSKEKMAKFVGYPAIVKASQGSDSIGTSLVRNDEELFSALKIAFQEDSYIVAEKFIEKSAEITCMILGNGNDLKALTPIEYKYPTEMLDIEGRKHLTYGLPDLSPEVLDEVKEYSILAHRWIGCQDYSRSDFLVGKDGKVYFLELNGHAGLGRNSSTTYICQQTYGWSYERMIEEVLNLALVRCGLA